MEWYGIVAIILAVGIMFLMAVSIIGAVKEELEKRRLNRYRMLVNECVEQYFEGIKETADHYIDKMTSEMKKI